ncbi:MAG: hypothetical protein Q7T45_11415 [Bradyrhizobium sp.]|uniref:hypothetical protein n=1 Tax=Bradyrhizobium sp. TaxID=376 RepID=UPI002723B854|nr:hypothetical protein [Bradyrhizobium sp.]MDO8398415.1 hypothetical protein [Bradyrhizobium sp.]
MDEKETLKIFEEVGRLCVSWSFLEVVTEAAIWGLLDIDDTLAPLITWNKDLEQRGKLIVEHGTLKHPSEEEALKKFNTGLRAVIQDRNIIVHGAVHKNESRPPCWTVWRGVGKGKNFPTSSDAAHIVRTNIDKLADQLRAFNARHNYGRTSRLSDQIENDWPKPL